MEEDDYWRLSCQDGNFLQVVEIEKIRIDKPMREQNESLFRRPMMERKKMQQKFVSMLGKSCSQHSSGFYKI